jgi:hypothetical protein
MDGNRVEELGEMSIAIRRNGAETPQDANSACAGQSMPVLRARENFLR